MAVRTPLRRGKKKASLLQILGCLLLVLIVLASRLDMNLANGSILSSNKDANVEKFLDIPDIQEQIDSSSSSSSWYQRYLEQYQNCSNHNNFVALNYEVKLRQYNNSTEFKRAHLEDIQRQVPSEEEEREFSLKPQAFARFHSNDCKTVSELLQAIQLGRRKWIDPEMEQYPTLGDDDNEEDMRAKWDSPSYFVPATCHIPFLSGEYLCQNVLANKFRHIIFLGDSLTRHVYQGFLMHLQPDFIRGWTKLASDPIMREYCYCDGQFSLHRFCRKNDPTTMFHNLQLLKAANYCGRYNTNHKIPTSYIHELIASRPLSPGYNDLEHVNCNDDDNSSDSGDVLLALNGGLWFESKAQPTFEFVMEKVLRNPRIAECAKQRKLIVIWTSYNTNHPDLHHEYPHQSPQNGHIFNQQMEVLFQETTKNVVIVNWMNMTDGAQVSDGLHFLIDVNTFKAQQILLLAHYMQREGMYYCDKELDETCVS